MKKEISIKSNQIKVESFLCNHIILLAFLHFKDAFDLHDKLGLGLIFICADENFIKRESDGYIGGRGI